MASKTPHTIWLKGDPQGREGIAGAAITPGDLLTIEASSVANADPVGRIHTVKPAVAGSPVSAVAREGDIFGKSIDDAYAVNDTVLFHIFRKGDMFYGRLAAGQTVTVGTILTSNGGGTLKVAAAATEDDPADVPLVVAMEPVTASAAGDRIKVEVI